MVSKFIIVSDEYGSITEHASTEKLAEEAARSCCEEGDNIQYVYKLVGVAEYKEPPKPKSVTTYKKYK